MTEQSTQLPDADQRTATRTAQALAAHWQAVADEQRIELDAAKSDAAYWKVVAHQTIRERDTAQAQLADLRASYALLRESSGWRRRVRRWAGL